MTVQPSTPYTVPERHSAQRVTDRQTDGWKDDSIVPIADKLYCLAA